MDENGNSISIDPREGTLLLTGEITDAAAVAVESQLSLLTNYYQHLSVTVKINSEGGKIIALAYIFDCLTRLRGQGVQIKTEASFKAMSAAAVLVALGDIGERVVKRQSGLLFHHPRVRGSFREITADNAGLLATALKESGDSLVLMMTSHLLKAFGDVSAFATQGMQRCLVLRSNHALVAQQLNLEARRTTPKWLSETERMWQKCRDSESYKAYADLLTRRHDHEDMMDLREAFALCLIDRVELVPAMQVDSKVYPDNVPRALHCAA